MKLINFIISSFSDSIDTRQILKQTIEMQYQLKSGLSLANRTEWTKDMLFKLSLLYRFFPPKLCFFSSSNCPFTATELAVCRAAFQSLCKSVTTS